MNLAAYDAVTAPSTAQKIFLLSERCSGSNWVQGILEATVDAQVSPCLCSYKHFFQQPCLRPPGLTVILARNPYDWLVSFHRSAWNAPSHQGLSFVAFLSRSWQLAPVAGAPIQVTRNASGSLLPHARLDARNSCPAPEYLMPAAHDQWPTPPPGNVYRLAVGCRRIEPDDLPWRKGLPASYCGLAPAYEARHDGTPFRNVLQMRSAKLHNYLRVLSWRRGAVELLSYNDLLVSEGAPLRWLSQMRDAHSLRLKNGTAQRLSPVLVQYKGGGGHVAELGAARWNSSAKREGRDATALWTQDVCHSTSLWTPALLCLVNRQLDWAAEAAFGFRPALAVRDCDQNVSTLKCDGRLPTRRS